MENGR